MAHGSPREQLCLMDHLHTVVAKLQQIDTSHLPSLEDYVKEKLAGLIHAEDPILHNCKTLLKILPRRDKAGQDENALSRLIMLSGSIAEGAMMARCFQCRPDWRELEGDLMYNFVSLPPEVCDIVEAVEGKPGFVRLPYDTLFEKYFRPAIPGGYLERHKECKLFHKTKFISPTITKHNVRNLVRFKDSSGRLEKLLSSRWGRCVVRGSDSHTETSTEVVVDVTAADGTPLLHGSLDHVPAIRLFYWPPQAAAWVTRPRRWPSKETVQNIVVQGCQLVPRSSPGGDEHAEWRLSFSIAEAELAKMRSTQQAQAYYAFKILFYRYLKCKESSHVSNATEKQSYNKESVVTGESKLCEATGESQSCEATGESQSCEATGESQSCETTGESHSCEAAGESESCEATGEFPSCEVTCESTSCKITGESTSCKATATYKDSKEETSSRSSQAQSQHRPLFSYVIKSCMLWTCEHHPPDDIIWRSLTDSVNLLLCKLEESLQCAHLEHYFIPGLNLMGRMSVAEIERCLVIVQTLRGENVLMFLPFDMEEKVEFVKKLQGLIAAVTLFVSFNPKWKSAISKI